MTTQISGVTFSNTEVLTAGISLNEIDFPPHSGVNVAIDNGGPITISFATPINAFGAYFTYTEPLSLSNGSVTTASAFSNNTGTGGDPASAPNEFIQISSLTGFSVVVIEADPLGGSFAMDDVTFSSSAAIVPEPAPVALFTIGLLAATCLATHQRRRYLSSAP